MKCCGCGEEFPEPEGPAHPYILSAPGCWKAYGELLAREYADPAYWPLHRMTVDAYAVQHPGVDTPQARRSVGIHLSRLCLTLQMDWPLDRVNSAMEQIAARERLYPWLTPPLSRGNVTVRNVLEARDARQHAAAVQQLARSVWLAWAEHHATVQSWLSGQAR